MYRFIQWLLTACTMMPTLCGIVTLISYEQILNLMSLNIISLLALILATCLQIVMVFGNTKMQAYKETALFTIIVALAMLIVSTIHVAKQVTDFLPPILSVIFLIFTLILQFITSYYLEDED